MFLISGHMVFGMLTFSYLFEWSAEDALYFVATTISTIGFGDIVPENTFAYLLFFVYIVTGKNMSLRSLKRIVHELNFFRFLKIPSYKSNLL